MFSFLSQGPLGELLAPVKSPQQQLHAAIEEHQNDKVRAACLLRCGWCLY